MYEQIKWRFPLSNYSKKKDISSSEFETFKKDPFKSLAREILQNSIDAIHPDEDPVKVEFYEFEIDRKDIPGISGDSKGVGKYAAYGTSRFSLIFYSTKTIDGYEGSIGVTELVSSERQDDSAVKDWTQGTGFYSKTNTTNQTLKC